MSLSRRPKFFSIRLVTATGFQAAGESSRRPFLEGSITITNWPVTLDRGIRAGRCGARFFRETLRSFTRLERVHDIEGASILI